MNTYIQHTLYRTAAVTLRSILLTTCCLILLVTGLQAETYYVSTKGSDANTGIGSWENAVEHIATAIDRAGQGDTIWLSNGTHALNGELTIAQDITLRGYSTNASDTTIDGGYPDRENRCLTLNHPNALVRDLTIQHGFYNFQSLGGGGVYINSGGTVSNCIVRSNRCQRFGGGIHIAQNGLVSDSVITDNLSVTDTSFSLGGGVYISVTGRVERCRIVGNTARRGGGVYINHDGTISDVDVYDNRSHERGGGVYVYEKANLLNCNLIGNSATGGASSAAGGGFYAHSAVMPVSISGGCAVSNSAYDGGGLYGQALTEIRRVDIRDNTADRNGGGGYGGIYHDCMLTGNQAVHGGGIFSPHSVYNCIITTNTSSTQGGGIYLYDHERVVVSNCVVAHNKTLNNAGGGILCKFAPLEVEIVDCLISNNHHKPTATFGGGGIGADTLEAGKTLLIHRCLIVNNIAGARGGGVYICGDGFVKLQNNLIAGNTAENNEGGGVYLDLTNADSLIENCTIMNNTSATAAQTAGLWGPTAKPLAVVNSIIYNNADIDDTVYNYPAEAALYFTNCCLYPLPQYADNVITAMPAVIDASSGNFRLSDESPCINRGIYQAWMEHAVDLDQRPRLDRLTQIVDIGCYEYIPAGIMFLIR